MSTFNLFSNIAPSPAPAPTSPSSSPPAPPPIPTPSSGLTIDFLDNCKKAGINEAFLHSLGYTAIKTHEWLAKFITEDPDMQRMKSEVVELASPEYFKHSVVIYGETGTGKELIARALHGDTNGNFVALNCTGLPEELFESELFGHVEGAFTGAVRQKVGLFQHAQNGTLFLDEISRMPLFLQAKLLRVLQERTIRPVGANKEERVNVRVIAASQQPLADSPNMLPDLYWRLATYELHITPLRDRPGDILEIVDSKFPQHQLGELELEELAGHRLSGNVRELEARVRRLLFQKKLTKQQGTK